MKDNGSEGQEEVFHPLLETSARKITEVTISKMKLAQLNVVVTNWNQYRIIWFPCGYKTCSYYLGSDYRSILESTFPHPST